MKNIQTINRMINSEVDPAFAIRAKYIVDQVIKHRPKKILDAGCGRGYYIKLLSMLDFPTEIVGIDLSDKYLAIAKNNINHDKRVKLIKGSVDRIPFSNNYFDLIICSEVLEHLPDDKAAVKEFHRVIKKNGILVVTVPNKNYPLLWDPINWLLEKLFNKHVNKNIWWLAGIWADHERLYSKQEIINLLNSKFRILNSELILHWCWPASHFLLYGIGKNIVERNFVSDFSRFTFTKKPPIVSLIARFIALPSDIFDSVIPTQSSVNICLDIIKKK